MHITAKVDYAVRTLVELAAVGPDPAKAEFLAKSQVIPHKFLEAVLSDLRRGGLVNSRRGPDGGYWLARSADEIDPHHDRPSDRCPVDPSSSRAPLSPADATVCSRRTAEPADCSSGKLSTSSSTVK